MEEVILLFLYHELNAVTRRHFEALQRLHPREQIVPLTYQFEGREALPGSVPLTSTGSL